jgi:starch-binding outer membrane protein, SusD/RagB family
MKDMNRSVSICLFTLAVLLSFSACKKEETEPKDWILDDLVWDDMDKNATIAQWVLNDAYNYMPTGYNRIGATGSVVGDYLDCAAGDAVPSRNNRPVEAYTNGRVSVQNNPDP